MNQPAVERTINVRVVTIYVIKKIIAANKFGLTMGNLVREIVSFFTKTHVPLYLGPGWTLKQLLNDYVMKGELEYGTLLVNGLELSWLRPTQKFDFVPNEAMEKFITSQDEVTARDKTLDVIIADSCFGS